MIVVVRAVVFAAQFVSRPTGHPVDLDRQTTTQHHMN
jgi:hypothetical protein